MAPVVKPRKVNLNFPHKLREIGQFQPQGWHQPICINALITAEIHIALLNILIAKLVFGDYPHQDVKVVAHQTKSQISARYKSA